MSQYVRHDGTRSSPRQHGHHELVVLSIDFGRRNLSYWIGKVHAQPLTKAQGATLTFEDAAYAARSRRIDEEPSQEADITIPISTKSLRVDATTYVWRRIDFQGIEDGSSIVNTDTQEGGALGMNIKRMMMFLVSHGHLDALFDLCDTYSPLITIFEQQFGPSRRAVGNPGMFALMYTVYTMMLHRHPRWRIRPPEFIGPRASLKTCDLIQDSAPYLHSKHTRMIAAEARTGKGKAKRKLPSKYKKQQVVHVTDWLMDRYKPHAQWAYRAAKSKRDDMADCLLQVVSYFRCHQLARMKREQRKRIFEACVLTNGVTSYIEHMHGTTNPKVVSVLPPQDMLAHFHDGVDMDMDMDIDIDMVENSTSKRRRLTVDADTNSTVDVKAAAVSNHPYRSMFPPGHYVVYLLLATDGGISYVGCTNDFHHRFRQHQGELSGGAKYTKRSTHWEPAIIVSGFACKSFALSFEANWKRVKGLQAGLPRFVSERKHRSLSKRAHALATLLHNPDWSRRALTVHYLWCDKDPTYAPFAPFL